MTKITDCQSAEDALEMLLKMLTHRPRRNRNNEAIRSLVRETQLQPSNLVLPIFIVEGKNRKEEIRSMPGVFRLSTDLAIEHLKTAHSLGIKATALFPAIEDKLKCPNATESLNSSGLLPKSIQEIKACLPDLLVISDVAMDPYSSDGHDGLVKNGKILNDETLEILGKMAVLQAQSGADLVAPSDMMDGRVGYIRNCLDQAGYTDTGILSYTAKYCSTFYGPFREALDSAPKSGDKKSYQMDPANSNEALRELQLDLEEGADLVMVKPAHTYLDIIAKIKSYSTVPVAAYHVSGEYAMIAAAAEKGFLNFDLAMMEVLTSIKRAGADVILSYYALEAAKRLTKG